MYKLYSNTHYRYFHCPEHKDAGARRRALQLHGGSGMYSSAPASLKDAMRCCSVFSTKSAFSDSRRLHPICLSPLTLCRCICMPVDRPKRSLGQKRLCYWVDVNPPNNTVERYVVLSVQNSNSTIWQTTAFLLTCSCLHRVHFSDAPNAEKNAQVHIQDGVVDAHVNAECRNAQTTSSQQNDSN